jgi:malate dehydrogenase (quinone)
MQSQGDRIDALRDFVPTVRGEDWKLEIAGQRVQIIKAHPTKGGALEFGTELIRSADGSLTALLGASPGASTAVSIMLGMLQTGITVMSSAKAKSELAQMLPEITVPLNGDASLVQRVAERTRAALKLG